MARGRGRPPKSRLSSDSLLVSDSNGTDFSLSRPNSPIDRSCRRSPRILNDELIGVFPSPMASSSVALTKNVPNPHNSGQVLSGSILPNSPKTGVAIVVPSPVPVITPVSSSPVSTQPVAGVRTPIVPKPKPMGRNWAEVTKSKNIGMSLFFDEDSANSSEIDIHLDEVQDEIAKWKFTLMGNVLGAKPSQQTVSEFTQKHWNFGPLPLVQYFKKGWFSFKFDSEEAMNAVLRGGPWKIGSNSLVLKQWSPHFSCIMECVTIVPVWILFPDLDPYMWTDSILSKMASKIGKPLFADLHTTCKARLSFARILVEVDISKDLPDHIDINAPFIGHSSQRIVYEWLPYYCKTCLKLGHTDSNCKRNRPAQADAPKSTTIAQKAHGPPGVIGQKKHAGKQVSKPVTTVSPVTDPPSKLPVSGLSGNEPGQVSCVVASSDQVTSVTPGSGAIASDTNSVTSVHDPPVGSSRKKKSGKQVSKPATTDPSVLGPSIQLPDSGCHLLGGTSAPQIVESVVLLEGANSECLVLGSPPLVGQPVSPSVDAVKHSECSVLGQDPCVEGSTAQMVCVTPGYDVLTSENTTVQLPCSPNKFSVLASTSEQSTLEEGQGFNKLVKHLEVVNFLQHNKIDILGLLETRVKLNKSHRILRSKFKKYRTCSGSTPLVQDFASASFHLSVVYGSNCSMARQSLWNSLIQQSHQSGPWVVMGDFNIVRYAHEKISNTPPDLTDMTDFNSYLSECGLDDMHGSGIDFTCFNKQEVNTRVYSKLDRVLINADWLISFTQTTAQFLPPGISDHCPALLSFSNDPLPKKQFKFLNCWIDHPEFLSKVAEAWQISPVGNSMHRLMAKLKNTKKSLSALHLAHFSNISARVKLKQAELNQCFLDLQQSPLSEDLILKEKIASQEFWALKEAETKILIQKAKVHDIEHNDSCSKFFFAKIKERQQSQYIGEIQDIHGSLHIGLHDVGEAFVDYYQQLLGSSSAIHPIDPCFIPNGQCLSDLDQAALIAPISRTEIQSALFSIHSSKSPGIDGFSSGFFKAAWDIIADDFCLAVLDYFKTSFMPKQANISLITLIPKKRIVSSVKDFRPISCCSIIYKTISKVLTVRLQGVMDKLVGKEQAAFISGRSLHGNVMLTQSLIKGYSRKFLTPRCLLKVDISKAFDSIQWPFIQDMLGALNFPPPFIKWIMGCVTGPWYTLKVNGSHHGFFKGKSGVRQGDPLSPLLFVLCMEILSRVLRVMCRDPNVSFHPKCAKLGLTHLIFADDLMIFTRGDVPSSRKSAEVLQLFSSWSGLRINFDKSETYFRGVDPDIKQQILDAIGLTEGAFPFRYLGLPIHPSRLSTPMFAPLIQKIQNLHSCTTNLLSYAGKLQVLNSIVFGIGNFWCGSLLLPKSICNLISSLCKQFFWGYKGGRKMVFKSWKSICAPWLEGGFQVTDLSTWNQACMLKWLWLLDLRQGSIWVEWVTNYYLDDISIWDLSIHDYFSDSIRGVILTKDAFVTLSGTLQQAKSSLNSCVVKGKFSLLKAYNLIRQHYQTKNYFKPLLDNSLLPRHRIILMLAVQRKLATLDLISTRGICLPNRCFLCKLQAESSRHLFFHCCYSKQVLRGLFTGMGLHVQNLQLRSLLLWSLNRSPRKHWRNKKIICCLAATVYSLWHERNRRIF
ncbi:uncharacterized protein LOC141639225 [Silene latifolia]|uniref:uncharacterized protein LOC141639225 n=1 Tax=Silene latifolia TaxID=37657 RepID=UPI003D772BAC